MPRSRRQLRKTQRTATGRYVLSVRLSGARIQCHEVLDATGEDDIARQAREDDAEAMRDMGRFARRGGPTGAARALLRILDKAPETALRVLG